MRLILLSDIHANLSALKSVIEDFSKKYSPDGIILLGDIINYGMRPNEVIELLGSLQIPILANIFGNHEKALFDGDTSHFSTDRGREILAYTRARLTDNSRKFLLETLVSEGWVEETINGKKFLFVHGSLSDPYWGKMTADEKIRPEYSVYDYVISGHSHIPDLSEIFCKDDSRKEYRNKKRTVFMNPGSVGQPRNHNSRAQYLYIDTDAEIFHFNSVEYDISQEQSLYDGTLVDKFYKERLTNGI